MTNDEIRSKSEVRSSGSISDFGFRISASVIRIFTSSPRVFFCVLPFLAALLTAAAAPAFRPPAVPLVACDPYFSIWSRGDNLTDANTTHWTGRAHRLTSMVRIDGKPFRLMGKDIATIPPLAQTSLEVLPTRTIYSFAGQGVTVSLTFMTAALPDNLDLLSRPVTYLIWSAQSADGKPHDVSVYFDASAELTVENLHSEVTHEAGQAGDLRLLKLGSVDQPILEAKGDDLRIDWGYFYAAAPGGAQATSAIADRESCQSAWVANGTLPEEQQSKLSANSPATATVAAFSLNFGNVESKPTTRWLMVAYDDLYSIQYMKHNLRPYWRRDGLDMVSLLKQCASEFDSLRNRCEKFDGELMADLVKAGGENYARLCALAYRTCFAAGKFVADAHGQPLQFCKENHSNGCIATSDVFYPMSPQFLLFGPTLAKSFVVPFMNYAASDRWRFPFAPHDLGTYPHANGQVYGDGERGVNNQMPVEESGNLLLLFGAISQMDGNADFASLYWKQLEQWANYLKSKGFDPENQLCTDDFAGHLAHNVNLSVKAIVALGAFGRMCEMRGDQDKAKEFSSLAKSFADRWIKEARQGDHFRLAFDQPDTWSQKYNLVWDRILGLNLFPAQVLSDEMKFYKRVQNKYGLPLDNRRGYTKLDWTLWTATLTQDPQDFAAIFEPVYRSLNETTDRSPLTDWYETANARKVGFTARPVVGGVFLQMLYNRDTWQKWARRDLKKASNWAAMPKAPKIVTVVPAADHDGADAKWRFTTDKPQGDWSKPGFDDSAWKEGSAGFGAGGPPGARIKTPWATADIWLRRQMEIPATPSGPGSLELWMHHDEDAEVFVNGVLASRVRGYSTSYEPFALTPDGKAAIKTGANLIAIHCHQTTGGQYIDAGFVEAISQE